MNGTIKKNKHFSSHLITFVAALLLSMYLPCNTNAQLRTWTILPNYQIDFNNGAGTIQPIFGTSGPGLSYAPYKKQNCMHKADGSLWFLLRDGVISGPAGGGLPDQNKIEIYDGASNYIGTLSMNLSQVSIPSSQSAEISIIPVPGFHTRFYLAGAGNYQILDMCASNGLPTLDPTVYLLPSFPGSVANGNTANTSVTTGSTTNLGCSKIMADGNRYFCVSYLHIYDPGLLYYGTELFIYKITSTGIDFVSSQLIDPACSGVLMVNEMELSASANGSSLRIATPAYNLDPTSNPHYRIDVVDFNVSSGVISATIIYDLPQTLIPSFTGSLVPKGLEFTADGKFLYFTVTPAPSPVNTNNYNSLFRINFTTNSIESLANLPNNADYKFSMIELGRDGNMYYNAGNRLSRITNPNEIDPMNLLMDNDPFVLVGAIPAMGQTPCCQTTGSYQLNIYNLPDQLDGDNYSSIWASNNFVTIQNNSIPACANASNPATLTATGNGLASYVWSTGQTTAAITSTVAGTYTVTATDYCGNTCSSNYSLISCCQGTPGYEINGDVKISDMINNPGPYANFFFFQTGTGRWTIQTNFNCSPGNNSLKVTLNGRLTIDVNTDFTSLELVCGPDAEIVVAPNYQLRLYETCNYLHGCGSSMWKGITLQGNNYALEVGSESWIEDAKQAVTATNNAKFWLNNTIFNKNFAAVVVTNTGSIANTSNIVNCKFQCNNLQTGLPAKCLSPYQNQRSTYGVWLTRVDGITIGETSLAYPGTNYFQNLEYGIYCNKSDALIRNNVFTNLAFKDPIYQSEVGYGIYATGTGSGPLLTSSITVGENTPTSTNYFNNCVVGVYINSYTDAVIQNNTFLNSSAGITISSLKNKSVAIFNNFFETNYSAVFGSDIKNSTAPIAVYNNQINTIKGNGFNGIRLGSNNGLNFKCNIYNNIIKSCRNSISVISANEANVSNNTISITLPVSAIMPNHVGILGRGCNTFNCYSNAINWVNHPTLNLAYQTKVKAFLINGCSNGFIELNHNYNCGIGFETIGLCPNLLYTCNDNHGCYTAFYMTGSTLPNQYTDVNGNSLANGNTYFSNVGTFKIDGMSAVFPTNWFYDSNDQNADPIPSNPFAVTIQGLNASSICSNPIAPPDDEMINRFITDSITYSIYPDENNYLGDEYAYEALKNSSNGFTNLDSMLKAQFVDSLDNRTIGQFYEIERLLNDDDENYSLAAALNNSINDNRIIAINKKTVNEIYLHSLAAGVPLDSADKAALYAIAIQNSMAGGNGVFWARSLLGLEFEDELNTIFRTAQTTLPADKLNTRVTVVPNPTNGKVVVSANENIENVMAYDGMLAPISSPTLLMDSQTMQLDLGNEKSGCFILKVIFKTHTEYYKVILIK